MEKDEFVALHGQQIWEILVVPLLASENEKVSANAALITHADILLTGRRLDIGTDNGMKGMDGGLQYYVLQEVIKSRPKREQPLHVIA